MNKFYTRYSPNRNNRLMNCKRNVIHVNNHDSLKHELSKCVGAIMLHRWGDVKFDWKVNDIISALCGAINMNFDGWVENHTDFLTEAWKSKDRRVDLVDLCTGNEFEFECDHKISKEGATTIYI